jgi:hypothetical protein
MCRCSAGRAREHSRSQFPEDRAVFAGKPSELPKAAACRDLGHGCRGRGTLAQSPPHHVHPPQQQKMLGPHTKMFLAADAQCPLRCSNFLTEVWNIDWFIKMLLDRPVKPPHDRRVLPKRRPVLLNLAAVKAINQGVDQRVSLCALCDRRPRSASVWQVLPHEPLAIPPGAAWYKCWLFVARQTGALPVFCSRRAHSWPDSTKLRSASSGPLWGMKSGSRRSG